MGEKRGFRQDPHTPRPDTSPRKADQSWIPPKRRQTTRLENVEAVLPRSLDPMYQGMKRTSPQAKHALFANYRAQVLLHRSLGTYTNLCRDQVSAISHEQRSLARDYRSKQRRKLSISRVKSAPPLRPLPSATPSKYAYSAPAQEKRHSAMTFSTESQYDSDDSDDNARPGKNWSKLKQKLNNRPKTAPRGSFFMTEDLTVETKNGGRRPLTAKELISRAEPLPSRLEPEDIDQEKLRSSAYYRRVTSPSLQGVVSNELAVFFRQMKIKV